MSVRCDVCCKGSGEVVMRASVHRNVPSTKPTSRDGITRRNGWHWLSAAHLICGENRNTTIVTTPRPATSSSSSIAAPMCASRCLLPAGCRWSVGRQISWCQSRKWAHGVVRRGRWRTHRERNHGIVVYGGVLMFPGPRSEYTLTQ